ncbi:MAG: PQQ-binding-like beta-propeller repeat protein, partial [Phycisphaerae bacterium]|nr:PQQ-binding-like beta-propeller repeat protein [Phycisphaerae bacterium]
MGWKGQSATPGVSRRQLLQLLCLPLVAFAGWLPPSATVWGQQRSSLYGRETLQGVYVRDSAIAVEKLALAERLERLREWNKSAEVYQEIIEQYPDRVVPARVDQDNQIIQYSSVASAVQERLAKWPPEGLAVYRNRYETTAQALLEASAPDDTPTLHRVATQFFVTETGKQAAVRLMELQLQNAEFAAAAWLGDRLLEWHPNLHEERATVLYRTAIAHRLAGNPDAAAAHLAALVRDHPEASGVVGGKEVRLAESLRAELSSETVAPTSVQDSWPTAFGNYSRDLVPAVVGAGGARLFSIPISRTTIRTPGNISRQQLLEIDRADREKGLANGILPVIDRGELFFQDNARVYALSLDSGLPLPGWAQTYPGERSGRYNIAGAWPTPLGTQMAVTVTADAVYAVLGQSDPRTAMYTGGGMRDARLVCLDRQSGRERWSFSSRSLREDRAAARGLELTGTPIVVGDRVFVCVQSGAGVQFQKCEVLALDAGSGRLVWRSYIASASNTVSPWDIEGALQDDVTPQLSYANGRVYVNSNLGAIAALEAYDGTIIWLNLYPRELPELNRIFLQNPRAANRSSAARRPRPWAHNPLIITRNRLFALPRNSEFLFIYDASNGAEISRIPLQPLDEADTLIGVTAEKLVLGSLRTVTCIDWTRFRSGMEVDEVLLWRKVFEKSGFDDASIRGRPFLTADSVFVPLAWRLTRLKLSSGAAISSYPADGRDWSEEEGPGNLLLTQDHLILAGSERVAVYTDLSLAMRRLDAEADADPLSPLPRIRYAEVMFVAGRYDLASRKLDEAIMLLGGPQSLQSGPERDRLFNSALSFARKLMSTDPAAAAVIDGFFDRAGLAASSASQQVAYRVARSRWARQQKLDAAELDLYQQILSDPALRGEPVSSSEGAGTISAAYFAQQEIAGLIARNPRVYAPVEQRAQREFDAIADTGDPDDLLAVAQKYPNSQVATRALLAAADAYESAGNPKSAISVLRTLLSRAIPKATRVGCLEALA